jgi:hypothetical protein
VGRADLSAVEECDFVERLIRISERSRRGLPPPVRADVDLDASAAPLVISKQLAKIVFPCHFEGDTISIIGNGAS